MSCHDCLDVRAGPDDVRRGYRACPGGLLEATAAWVCSSTEDDTATAA